ADLQSQKYDTAEWVNQTTAVPDAQGSAKIKTPNGLIDVRLTLAGNTIKAIMIGGDFFAAEGAVADLEASLRWHTADPKAVVATLESVYAKRTNDLASLPFDPLTQTIQQAIRRARVAESASRADPYGCFVTPEGAHV
ncbi:MAG: hypothetical protein HZB17_05210, partial [Chloroflexi bacterium]|nr:hypothetical protein [Chloroflexota bacterium]